MKVERNSPARSTRSVAQTAYARRVEAAAGPANSETIDPTANVLGIPEAEFTPKVRDAIMSLMNEVENLRHELYVTKIRLEDMEKAADQDGMLPLLNRRAFVRELTRYINMAGRYNMPVSLIYFDLNHLKKTNDTYGHAAGDAVLEHFALLGQHDALDQVFKGFDENASELYAEFMRGLAKPLRAVA